MAMACLRLVTVLPLRPDFSLPRFISRISRSTFLLADGEYLRVEDFLELDFFAVVLFFALDRDARGLRLELDFFLVAILVAITILLGGQMAPGARQVAYSGSGIAICGSRVLRARPGIPATGFRYELDLSTSRLR
jgi:hypothetical protein